MNKSNQSFILFAHARSGSNSLTNCLNLHPDLKVLTEPFHQDYSQWNPGEPNYLDSIVDITSLEKTLVEIFSGCNGIKVLDYQLPQDLYTHMLLMPQYKVIMLKRRNILQAVISGLLAEQTSVWQSADFNADTRNLYRNLEPLPLEELEKRLDYLVQNQYYFWKILKDRPSNQRILIDYEDLYTAKTSRNRLKLQKLFDFLGVEMPKDADFSMFIDPQKAKINHADTYKLLPNAKIIEEQYGNDDTGWLF